MLQLQIPNEPSVRKRRPRRLAVQPPFRRSSGLLALGLSRKYGRAALLRHCSRPPRRAVSSSQAAPRHTGLGAYGCLVPHLTRFAPPCCMGPNLQRHLRSESRRKRGASRGHSPCCGGLQVIHAKWSQGTANSPLSTAFVSAMRRAEQQPVCQECTTQRRDSQATSAQNAPGRRPPCAGSTSCLPSAGEIRNISRS